MAETFFMMPLFFYNKQNSLKQQQPQTNKNKNKNKTNKQTNKQKQNLAVCSGNFAIPCHFFKYSRPFSAILKKLGTEYNATVKSPGQTITHFLSTSCFSHKTFDGSTGERCLTKHRTKWAHITLFPACTSLVAEVAKRSNICSQGKTLGENVCWDQTCKTN